MEAAVQHESALKVWLTLAVGKLVVPIPVQSGRCSSTPASNTAASTAASSPANSTMASHERTRRESPDAANWRSRDCRTARLT